MKDVSVIIRNRNEEAHIGFAIQSVIDSFENPEIIIVDNNSIDDSMNVVSLFDRCNISTCSLDGMYTPGKALNFGVLKATSDTILILSAHSQITKSNLETLEKSLEDNVAVFGNQTPIYRGKKITKRYIWSHFKNKVEKNMYSTIEDRYFLHNAFCFYRKEVLIENPFDETLSGKEDRYWALDMREKGFNFLYDGINHKCNHFWTPNGATWKGIG